MATDLLPMLRGLTAGATAEQYAPHIYSLVANGQANAVAEICYDWISAALQPPQAAAARQALGPLV
jgi:hypothetical protein